MPLPNEGVDYTEGLSTDQAAEVLLNRLKDAREPSDNDDGAKSPPRSETGRNDPEDDENNDENESDDDDLILEDEDEDGDDQDNDEGDDPVEAPDNAIVKVTINGETVTVPVKDLTRLYGQEASLTRKSQEVAQQRKQADTELERFTAATGKLLEKAQEKFKPYADIDWAVAAKALDTEEYAALRKEARDAFTDVQFLQQEINGVIEQTKEARKAQLEQDAAKAIEVLSGENGIPGFNEEIYSKMADFAVSRGIALENYAQVVDPVALMILHDAMKYHEAKERAATKRKAAPTSTRKLKATKRSGNGRVGDKAGDALDKLRATGSRDDAVALLMQRVKDRSD